MAKKPLGKDSMGIQKTMRFGDYLGDGVGQIALNMMSALAGQLTYFYTEKIGMAAGAAATVLLIAKILDAFSDLVMGKIMDKTNSPKGKCRPWMLWMLVPTMAIIVLIFTVPKGSGGMQTAYALVTNILISAVIYTAVAIPYNSLVAVRTESTEERAKMGITRTIFGVMCGYVVLILLIPITNAMGGDQTAWVKLSVVFAVVSGLCLLSVYKTSKERVIATAQTEKEDISFVTQIGYLFKNKYWVIMLAASVCMNVAYGLSNSSGTYYAKYILGNDNLVSLLGLSSLVPTVIVFLLIGPMTNKFGMAKTCIITCSIGAAANAVRALMPYSIPVCVVGGAFNTLGIMPIMCVTAAMVNNCVEYNEWKFGERLIGMTNSANSFGGKIGSGLGGAMIGWLLSIAGYQVGASVQPGSINTAIFAFSIYIPLALFVVMAILFSRYDLEKIYPRIMSEIQQRRDAGKEGK